MMIDELRRRLLALGYEFASDEFASAGVEDGETSSGSEIPVESETSSGSETPVESEIPVESETPGGSEIPGENETPEEGETPALRLALRRALAEVRRFCNLLEWPENWPEEQSLDVVWQWPWELREAFLDLAAAGFLQSKMALAPESLAVMPTLTSLRLGDVSWSFGGGTQRSGTDALTRTENLTAELRRQARAVMCAWRSIY